MTKARVFTVVIDRWFTVTHSLIVDEKYHRQIKPCTVYLLLSTIIGICDCTLHMIVYSLLYFCNFHYFQYFVIACVHC